MCEIAAQANEKGSSVYKGLEQLYVDFGFYSYFGYQCFNSNCGYKGEKN